MKKTKIKYISIIIVITLFLLIICGLFYFNGYFYSSFNNNKLINTGSIINTGGLNNNLSNDLNKELIKSKLEIIKNRMRVKDIISKGDNYFQNDQLSLAVIQYKIALNKNPEDYKMIEKVGDIYFELKDFTEANNYYGRLLKNIGFDNNKYILSLIYSKDLTKKNNLQYIKNEIEKNVLDKEKVYFYSNALFCLEDFHLCKKNFDEKIMIDKEGLKSIELLEIKNTLKTYNDFGLIDLYYKNSLIIGSFMKLNLYPIAIELGKKLLAEKQDYKAIIQIIAQSYFELGNYKYANAYLKKYFEQTPTDGNAAYILGIINLKLNDYILSNIFLNKALYIGYKDTINVKRKIAYNYFMLNEYDKMYKLFDEIIKTEKNITKDDLNIMINHAIDNKLNDKVYDWTKKGLKLFPKEALFYAYMGKLEYDLGKYSVATIYIRKGLLIEPNNQLLNYVYGLIYLNTNKSELAKETFQKAYDIDKKSVVGKEIFKELEKL